MPLVVVALSISVSVAVLPSAISFTVPVAKFAISIALTVPVAFSLVLSVPSSLSGVGFAVMVALVALSKLGFAVVFQGSTGAIPLAAVAILVSGRWRRRAPLRS